MKTEKTGSVRLIEVLKMNRRSLLRLIGNRLVPPLDERYYLVEDLDFVEDRDRLEVMSMALIIACYSVICQCHPVSRPSCHMGQGSRRATDRPSLAALCEDD
jgi:hypothetical protein